MLIYVSGVTSRKPLPGRLRTSVSCAAVLRRPSAGGDALDLARTLQAIADPNRIRLLRFIAAQPGGEACVCHLTAPVGLTQPTVSHHLRVLHEAGFLGRERRGAWVFYRILPGRFHDLREELSAIEMPLRAAGPRLRRSSKRVS